MKPELKSELEKIRDEFYISNTTLMEISNLFYNDMNEKSMLKMLNTYIDPDPEKVLEGEYLTIDLGGSNMRICKFKINGSNAIADKVIKFPLVTKFRDYTTKKYTLRDLFVIALKKMKPFLDKDKLYNLGVTVSFGLKSKSKDEAVILELSKGFELSETLGEDIYKLLTSAIEEVKLKIIPSAIINDCVATMVAGKFFYPNADISFIVGTGHNACFINFNKEIINVESAGFNKGIPLTCFDEKFILTIPNESQNLLEILVGGKYIGGIADRIMRYLVERSFISKYKPFSTKELIGCLNKEIILSYPMEQKELMEEIAKILFERSAKLIAAEILAILMYTDNKLENKHTIIFDGSVYEKCDFFREQISLNLEQIFFENYKKLSHRLVKDASGIGPAIVAAAKSVNVGKR